LVTKTFFLFTSYVSDAKEHVRLECFSSTSGIADVLSSAPLFGMHSWALFQVFWRWLLASGNTHRAGAHGLFWPPKLWCFGTCSSADTKTTLRFLPLPYQGLILRCAFCIRALAEWLTPSTLALAFPLAPAVLRSLIDPSANRSSWLDL